MKTLVLAATLLVVGCASGVPPTANTTGTASPSASTPSLAPAAAIAYAAAAKRFNVALDAARKKLGSNTEKLAPQKTFWTTIAKANATFQADIKAISFPPELADEVDAMIKAVALEQVRALRATRAKSAADMSGLAADALAASDAASDAATILRDALGLPPNT